MQWSRAKSELAARRRSGCASPGLTAHGCQENIALPGRAALSKDSLIPFVANFRSFERAKRIRRRARVRSAPGLLNKQIAYELSISEATVKAHVSAILFKLDVDSRTQAVIAASKLLSRDSTALVVAN
jgi:DNA-binding CsgD family transcriptional regulator